MLPLQTEILATLLEILSDLLHPPPPKKHPGYAPDNIRHYTINLYYISKLFYELC